MRLVIFPMDVKPNGETGPGAVKGVRDYSDKTIQIDGGVGSYDVEVSLDGIKFHKAITGINADGIHPIPQLCSHIRINATANTTAPTVTFGGYLNTD